MKSIEMREGRERQDADEGTTHLEMYKLMLVFKEMQEEENEKLRKALINL